MSENFDDITDGPISIDRAKHHCGRLAVDCGWRAMEVEMHIDAQAKIIAALRDEVRAMQEIIAAYDDLTRNWRGHNDRLLQAMAATDAGPTQQAAVKGKNLEQS